MKTVREFIVANFLFGDSSALKDNTSFLDSGIIDSTGMLQLISFLEESYHISIKPEEMVPENLDSIRQISAFLAHKSAPFTSNLETPNEPIFLGVASH